MNKMKNEIWSAFPFWSDAQLQLKTETNNIRHKMLY